MGQPQARKSRKHKNGNHPLHRTRNYGRDIDQIHEDLTERQKTLIKNTVVLDEDKPGLGQFYCVECARYFTDENTLVKHKGTKVHKRRYHPEFEATADWRLQRHNGHQRGGRGFLKRD